MDRNHNTPRFHQEQISVRLVRACGSKLCKSGHLQTIHEVRLVRACGSKQGRAYRFRPDSLGQARKSLWIETELPGLCSESHAGQARKSLWIETLDTVHTTDLGAVRLVRACGSKPASPGKWSAPIQVRLVRACGSKPCNNTPASPPTRSGS